jgi:Domain of unknown function (DUF4268)
MTQFGTLVPVNVRQLWPHEERDFTPWLCDNVDELSRILGLDIELIGREVDVGGFFLDILARETGLGRYIVIENQFGQSDHDHLGKLLTYAGGKQAAVLVWIAEKIRDEHRQALEWLNEHSDDETLAFGIELAAFRIDDSKPVFQFRPVVQPNDWARESRISRPNSELTGLRKSYQSFFQVLIDELRDKHRFTNAKLGQAQSWYSFSSGFRGIKFGAWFGAGGKLCAEIYLDGGDRLENKRRFDVLFSQKDMFDKQFGQSLEWQRLEDKQASRICIKTEGVISDEEQQVVEHRKWLVDKLLRLKALWHDQMRKLVMDSDMQVGQASLTSTDFAIKAEGIYVNE